MGNEISLLNLSEIIGRNRCAFLCGNGFSINFDKTFSSIYDNLYSAHKDVIHKSEFKVKSNNAFKKKCNENYKNVLRYLRYFSEDDLMKIFEDAVLFAESIKNNKKLITEFWESGIISKLTFGLSEVDPLNQICKIFKEKGISSVNIEHWTILIYFYAAIINNKPSCYELPSNNSFITVLNHGNISRIKLITAGSVKADIQEDVIFNGFTTYFRMLFSIAIFSNGKAVTFTTLENRNNLDINNLIRFLNRFKLLITLNYDLIMEAIVEKKVEHLHGEFVINKKEYVYNQSYGVNFLDGYVSFSDILIGDYFTFKSSLPIISDLSVKSNFHNKRVPHFSKKIEKLISENAISTVLIFGVNIENDQHVLRNLMLAFYNAGVLEPNIIYAYFNENEKQEFGEELKKVITFSKEVNEYCREIKVDYIQTKDILDNHFYKELCN